MSAKIGTAKSILYAIDSGVRYDWKWYYPALAPSYSDDPRVDTDVLQSFYPYISAISDQLTENWDDWRI